MMAFEYSLVTIIFKFIHLREHLQKAQFAQNKNAVSVTECREKDVLGLV